MLQNMQRKTINLIGTSAEALGPFMKPGTAERAALEDMTGESLGSESDVLRALVVLGARAARDHQLELGYAEWAAAWDEEDEQWSQAAQTLAAEAWRNDES
jgi:hypothetical protein